MASSTHLIPQTSLLSLIILSLLFLSSSTYSPINSVHDLLRSHGLPGGLIPLNIKSYTLYYPNHLLEVHMEAPCLTMFESHVFFDSVVKANLSYHRLFGVQGLTQEDLFLWLPVKDILVNETDLGLVTFDIGFAYKRLPAYMFDEPRYCVPIGRNMIEQIKRDGSKPKIKNGRKDNKPYMASY